MSGHANVSLDRMSSLLKIVLVLSVALAGVGASGMILSFMYMASAESRGVTFGASIFIGGTIFIAAGLIAAAVVSAAHRD
jgi:heme/copper-type cytochrome/quinol oxidase subunit 4